MKTQMSSVTWSMVLVSSVKESSLFRKQRASCFEADSAFGQQGEMQFLDSDPGIPTIHATLEFASVFRTQPLKHTLIFAQCAPSGSCTLLQRNRNLEAGLGVGDGDLGSIRVPNVRTYWLDRNWKTQYQISNNILGKSNPIFSNLGTETRVRKRRKTESPMTSP